MPLPNMSLGRHLKEYRERKGMTLLELAEKVDSTMQYVCDVESGRRPLRYERIGPWAKALGIEPFHIGVYLLSQEKDDIEKRSGIRFDIDILPKGAPHSPKQAGEAARPTAR